MVIVNGVVNNGHNSNAQVIGSGFSIMSLQYGSPQEIIAKHKLFSPFIFFYITLVYVVNSFRKAYDWSAIPENKNKFSIEDVFSGKTHITDYAHKLWKGNGLISGLNKQKEIQQYHTSQNSAYGRPPSYGATNFPSPTRNSLVPYAGDYKLNVSSDDDSDDDSDDEAYEIYAYEDDDDDDDEDNDINKNNYLNNNDDDDDDDKDEKYKKMREQMKKEVRKELKNKLKREIKKEFKKNFKKEITQIVKDTIGATEPSIHSIFPKKSNIDDRQLLENILHGRKNKNKEEEEGEEDDIENGGANDNMQGLEKYLKLAKLQNKCKENEKKEQDTVQELKDVQEQIKKIEKQLEVLKEEQNKNESANREEQNEYMTIQDKYKQQQEKAIHQILHKELNRMHTTKKQQEQQLTEQLQGIQKKLQFFRDKLEKTFQQVKNGGTGEEVKLPDTGVIIIPEIKRMEQKINC
ncbi:uncharacterized protein PMUG01_07047800 [Plasmodium malariae]|uniref:Uncharacterized protein n=1 Tax=Plasmodium malariae TaxID=5858 RepID=A0A1D3JN56_PLAMA|nr:uncharacterized protein PMUG01_07047800 [Plasmodium malariae]SBT88014.1 hypothetical protein PMUG01_07047800 [Plasmodium malariae]